MASAYRSLMSAVIGISAFAAGVSCSSNEQDLFHEPSPNSAGVGTSGAGVSGAPPEGGRVGAAGAFSFGGVGGVGGSGSGAAGQAPSGGRAGSGGTASSTAGSSGTSAGAAGKVLVCDDADECTVDAASAGVCVFTPVSCPPSMDVCLENECDPTTGMCASKPVADGAECDDGNTCSYADRCTAGVCGGSPDVTLETDDEQPIPDGLTDCAGVRLPLSFTWNVDEPGTVIGVAVKVELAHPFASDLEIMLKHEPSGREVRVLSQPDTPGASFDGEYVFEDGALAMDDIEYEPIPPGNYEPQDSLNENLEDIPVTGSWFLILGDACAKDAGTLRSASVTLARTCP
jgi:hypothetical protein